MFRIKTDLDNVLSLILAWADKLFIAEAPSGLKMIVQAA